VRITASTDIDNVKPPEDVPRYVELALQDIVQQVNGNLTFAENIRCKLLSITFSSSDTDTTVTHGMGRVPAGYIVSGKSVACSVYDGSVDATAQTITLKSSAAATVGLIVF
jgi:hypothetical protein